MAQYLEIQNHPWVQRITAIVPKFTGLTVDRLIEHYGFMPNINELFIYKFIRRAVHMIVTALLSDWQEHIIPFDTMDHNSIRTFINLNGRSDADWIPDYGIWGKAWFYNNEAKVVESDKPHTGVPHKTNGVWKGMPKRLYLGDVGCTYSDPLAVLAKKRSRSEHTIVFYFGHAEYPGSVFNLPPVAVYGDIEGFTVNDLTAACQVVMQLKFVLDHLIGVGRLQLFEAVEPQKAQKIVFQPLSAEQLPTYGWSQETLIDEDYNKKKMKENMNSKVAITPDVNNSALAKSHPFREAGFKGPYIPTAPVNLFDTREEMFDILEKNKLVRVIAQGKDWMAHIGEIKNLLQVDHYFRHFLSACNTLETDVEKGRDSVFKHTIIGEAKCFTGLKAKTKNQVEGKSSMPEFELSGIGYSNYLDTLLNEEFLWETSPMPDDWYNPVIESNKNFVDDDLKLKEATNILHKHSLETNFSRYCQAISANAKLILSLANAGQQFPLENKASFFAMPLWCPTRAYGKEQFLNFGWVFMGSGHITGDGNIWVTTMFVADGPPVGSDLYHIGLLTDSSPLRALGKFIFFKVTPWNKRLFYDVFCMFRIPFYTIGAFQDDITNLLNSQRLDVSLLASEFVKTKRYRGLVLKLFHNHLLGSRPESQGSSKTCTLLHRLSTIDKDGLTPIVFEPISFWEKYWSYNFNNATQICEIAMDELAKQLKQPPVYHDSWYRRYKSYRPIALRSEWLITTNGILASNEDVYLNEYVKVAPGLWKHKDQESTNKEY